MGGRARPEYAQVCTERALAEIGRGPEQTGSGIVANVTAHWERLVAADDLYTYSLGGTGAASWAAVLSSWSLLSHG
jgi:hypothetical protein